MPELELLPPTNPRLNGISRRVANVEVASDYIKKVVAAMSEIALGERDAENPQRKTLVGLAAPQIGEFVRVILFDKNAAADKPNFSPDLQFIINPEIVKASNDEVLGREGCYSTGEICAAVYRPQHIELIGKDLSSESVGLRLSGFQARIVQHEIDHLNGVRCPDRIRSPEHLHRVGPDDFQAYREDWASWQKLCSVEEWLKVKRGSDV